jgi:sec-independent protein translocase protein TatB
VFGLTAEKLLVIAVIAAFLIGPERLPLCAEKLGSFVRALRGYADTAKARVAAEVGTGSDDVEWKKLDPRQYDPRRIVRDALADDPAAEPAPAPPIAPWQAAVLARTGSG